MTNDESTGDDAVQILSPNHWTVPRYQQRVTSKQMKRIRATEAFPWFKHGEVCRIESRYVAPGHYDIWLEPVEATT